MAHRIKCKDKEYIEAGPSVRQLADDMVEKKKKKERKEKTPGETNQRKID